MSQQKRPRRRVLIALSVCLGALGGCRHADDASLEQTARAHCEAEGKRFVPQGSTAGVANQGTGHCVGPGQPGYSYLDPHGPLQRGAVSGRKQRVQDYFAVRPDCTNVGFPVTVLKKRPVHGTVRIANGEVFPNYPADNPRHACNVKKIPAVQIFYTSLNGYTGPDVFDVTTVYPDGGIRKDTIKIDVIARSQ